MRNPLLCKHPERKPTPEGAGGTTSLSKPLPLFHFLALPPSVLTNTKDYSARYKEVSNWSPGFFPSLSQIIIKKAITTPVSKKLGQSLRGQSCSLSLNLQS